MTLLTDPPSVAAFCARQADADYIAIDTEFMREGTYWPRLCLVQIAGPEEHAAIDPLAEGIDLAPLWDLLDDASVLKVFHSARQDIEIFYHLTGRIPHPLFDTQVAGMVCGFGDAVSYEKLVARLAGARVDKSSRFTDWSRRPLTDKQIDYALGDVIHLRPVYEKLRRKLNKTGREPWLDEEMATLTDPATYSVEPEAAWRRIKTRSGDPRFLAIVAELAAWRETEAQRRDLPRGRVLRDDTLLEIAAHKPKAPADLARMRGMGKATAEGKYGQAIVEAVQRALALPKEQLPAPPGRRDLPTGTGPIIELLRVLLKMKCEESGVAQKLVASAGDLEEIAADDAAPVPALHGWRRDLFGADALRLKHGELALAIDGNQVKVVDVG
ncbi:MAG: ribonuclease D [Alphaproteobacteria bacterium]|jgi:ribonuclease D|nr:ribonuclease D [Alphaproteobacteria bacterium]